jgi:hypothetical protein
LKRRIAAVSIGLLTITPEQQARHASGGGCNKLGVGDTSDESAVGPKLTILT